MAISKEEKAKERRIKKEYEKLRNSFEELPEVSINIIDGLLERTAFLRVMLEDMEADILVHGVTEEFTQSEKTAPYDRQRPMTQIYNQMSSNYQKVVKDLISHLPSEYQSKSESPETIMNAFIERREAS